MGSQQVSIDDSEMVYDEYPNEVEKLSGTINEKQWYAYIEHDSADRFDFTPFSPVQSDERLTSDEKQAIQSAVKDDREDMMTRIRSSLS